MIRVFLGGRLQPDLMTLPDNELTSIANSELADLLSIRQAPVASNVQRWVGSMPQYDVGHLQLVDQIEQHVSQHPGLQLVGNAYRGVGIPPLHRLRKLPHRANCAIGSRGLS